VIRKLIVLALIGAGFGAGIYVGVSMMRSRSASPVAPVATKAPVAASAPEAPRAAPAAPPPAPRPARRAPAARPEPAPVPSATAEAAPTAGVLNIDSDVPGAQVFIDRQFVGAAPVTGHAVAPGTHRVNVSAPGFEGVAETIEVEPGPRDLVVKLRLVRLDAAIEVVHKHRIGSCKGRLVATPQGMRYESSDKDDTFAAALLDLETLEVDYLKKNLKVKVRRGRTFDFTDPAGNADHLFVFHRDVEKARERLRKGDPPATP